MRKKDLMAESPRWCPGCGDYSVLSQLQTVMAKSGVPREQFVVVSGIGCSGRMPHYLRTYGIHGLHGRALPIAQGLRLARPDLSIWVVVGDGDAVSIGMGHFVHALRRDLNLNIVLLNNRTYGLTKGQASATTLVGQRTRSTPTGASESPVQVASIALASGATFVARTADNLMAHLRHTLEAAHAHSGTSVVEVLQGCPVYSADVTASSSPARRNEDLLYLQHGEPLRWGHEGATMGGWFEGPTLRTGAVTDVSRLWNHDRCDRAAANAIAALPPGTSPIPVGILYQA